MSGDPKSLPRWRWGGLALLHPLRVQLPPLHPHPLCQGLGSSAGPGPSTPLCHPCHLHARWRMPKAPDQEPHRCARETLLGASAQKASEHISAEAGLRTRWFLSFLSPVLTKMSSPALLPPAACVCFLAPCELLSADAVCFGSPASLGCRILPLAGTQTPPVPGIRIVSQSADQAALSLCTQGKPLACPVWQQDHGRFTSPTKQGTAHWGKKSYFLKCRALQFMALGEHSLCSALSSVKQQITEKPSLQTSPSALGRLHVASSSLGRRRGYPSCTHLPPPPGPAAPPVTLQESGFQENSTNAGRNLPGACFSRAPQQGEAAVVAHTSSVPAPYSHSMHTPGAPHVPVSLVLQPGFAAGAQPAPGSACLCHNSYGLLCFGAL